MRMDKDRLDSIADRVIENITDYLDDKGNINYRRFRYHDNLNVEDALLAKDITRDELKQDCKANGVEIAGSDIDLAEQYYGAILKEIREDDDKQVKTKLIPKYEKMIQKVQEWRKDHHKENGKPLSTEPTST